MVEIAVARKDEKAELAVFYEECGYDGRIDASDTILLARVAGRLVGAVRLYWSGGLRAAAPACAGCGKRRVCAGPTLVGGYVGTVGQRSADPFRPRRPTMRTASTPDRSTLDPVRGRTMI